MKSQIIQILQKHPNGLKAREIAALLPHADRTKVNKILYNNPSDFEVSRDYVWTLKQTEPAKKQKVLTDKEIQAIVEQAVTQYFEKKKKAEPPQKTSTKKTTSQTSPSVATKPNNAKQSQAKTFTTRSCEPIAPMHTAKTWEQSWKEKQEREERERKLRLLDKRLDPEWQCEKQRLHEEQERIEQERWQREEEYKTNYRRQAKPAAQPIRACIGDCATCTQDECILDKI